MHAGFVVTMLEVNMDHSLVVIIPHVAPHVYLMGQ